MSLSLAFELVKLLLSLPILYRISMLVELLDGSRKIPQSIISGRVQFWEYLVKTLNTQHKSFWVRIWVRKEWKKVELERCWTALFKIGAVYSKFDHVYRKYPDRDLSIFTDRQTKDEANTQLKNWDSKWWLIIEAVKAY